MGYPNLGKVKTIVLPIGNDEEITPQQYKEKYGIDLRDIIYIAESDSLISFKESNALVLVQDLIGYTPFPSIFVPNDITSTDHDEGNTDGVLALSITDNASTFRLGIEFRVNKDEGFTWENLRISRIES